MKFINSKRGGLHQQTWNKDALQKGHKEDQSSYCNQNPGRGGRRNFTPRARSSSSSYSSDSQHGQQTDVTTDLDKNDRKSRIAKGKLLNQQDRSRLSQFEKMRMEKLKRERQRQYEEEHKMKSQPNQEARKKDDRRVSFDDSRSSGRLSINTKDGRDSDFSSKRKKNVQGEFWRNGSVESDNLDESDSRSLDEVDSRLMVKGTCKDTN
jgi:hypothetical protein